MKEQIKESLAMGDEAIAYAAIDAGVTGVFGYPGTPSTEVFETAEMLIEKLNDGRVARWGANEKVGYELALGCSYSGRRTIVTMKHVGLNVAMDAFTNSAITGVRGGLVVLVADDPGMHSSQNEQDSRILADFAYIPILEPTTPQEAYDLTLKAFDLSEELKLPVMVRVVTRLAHSRGIVVRGETKSPVNKGLPDEHDRNGWVLVPSIARSQFKKLLEKQPTVVSKLSFANTITRKSQKIGVVLCGMGKAYFDELSKEYPELHEYTQVVIKGYPFDKNLIHELIHQVEKIYIFEENYPFIEDMFLARTEKLAKKISILGRKNNVVPQTGELDPKILKDALNLTTSAGNPKPTIELTPRPPRLCVGCGHIDAFNALKEAINQLGLKDQRVFGDIGCYTLGVYKPHEMIHACVEMGGSIGMTLGAALSGMTPTIGIIGDSTFMHSALPTLVSFVQSKVNANIVIMDNRITAMTGQQETVAVDIIPRIVAAMGMKEEHIHTMTPLPKFHKENVEKLTKILSHNGPDVIIFRRECVQAFRKGLYKKIDERKQKENV